MTQPFDKDTAKLVLTIVVIELVSGFTQGYYEPLIPKFGLELGVDASGLQLFNVIPTALAAVLVPFFTRMGDIKGYRFILRIVIPSVFIATILIWAGAAFGSWALVLVGRAFNGAIPVWMPLHIALVHSKTHGQTATNAVSAIVATMTLGTLLGTLTSGFVFNAVGSVAAAVGFIPVLHAICTALVIFVMPEYVTGADKAIDHKGFVLLGLFMIVAILGFTEVVEGGTDTAVGVVFLVAAAAVGVWWYRWEKRAPHPAIDTRVMFSRRLFPLYVAAMCFGAVFYGYLSPVATFLAADPATMGYGYAFGADAISIAETAITGCTVIAAVALPFVLRRLPAKATLIAGFAIALAAFAQWMLPGAGLVKVGLFVSLAGLGLGLVAAAIPVIIPERATDDTKGIATGLFNSSQTLGGALAGGLYVSLLKVGSGADGAITSVGYDVVWIACSAFIVIGLVVVAAFLAGDRASEAAREEKQQPNGAIGARSYNQI